MIKVGVLGARGRMGAEVVNAVKASTDCELVAALDLEIHLINFFPAAQML